jgi:membrane-associated phospholipid phosphatase
MKYVRRIIFSIPLFFFVPVLPAQTIQQNHYKDSVWTYPPGCYQKFNRYKFIGPAVLIGYGVAATKSTTLFDFSKSIRQHIWVDHPHATTKIDDYLQWVPAVSVYALNLAGIKGEHGYIDATMIFGISNLIMESFVSIIKNNSHEIRPDSSDYYSFPSGHAAEAFLSATFLFEEYKNVSLWYGIGGYLVAGLVGYLRMYNDTHWFHDVVAGAGFGISSAELTYWLYPVLKRTFFPKSCGKKMIVPVAEEHGLGLAFIQQF